MAATPQYCAFKFVGASRRTYSKDGYVSDINAALVRMDGGQGASATSPEEWVAPEPCSLVDYSMITGTADTEKIQITRNGIPTGDILRYSVHLTTNPLRPILNIPFAKGDRVTGIQISD